MNQEIFKNLNIPEIPNDINNLRSYNDLFKLFKISQEIVDNMNNYIEKIVYTEYLKTKNEWKEILSNEDYDKIKNIKYRPNDGKLYVNDNPYIFRCNKTNNFIPFIPKHKPSTTGAGGFSEKFKYDIENNTILVIMKITIYPIRRDGVPPIIYKQKYLINLLEKSVTEIN